jgi:hypothetical protein
LFYTILFQKKLVIDAHTGAWYGIWKIFWPLNKFVMQKSSLVIVTNNFLKSELEKTHIHAFVLEDKIPDLKKGKKIKLKRGVNIAVINTFSEDEPVKEILNAARKLSRINFYITGRLIYAKPEFISDKPKNVIYTDFLPESEYINLLTSVDAVMVLTKWNYTILSGAYEAVALNKPLIISDWPVLKRIFNKGTVYTDNSVDNIINAVKLVIKEKQKLKKEIRILKDGYSKKWNKKFKQMLKLIKVK